MKMNADTLKMLLEFLDKDDNNTISERKYKGEMVMAFLHRGFIFVGNIYSEGETIVLKNAMNCRYQNEGKGWGYIAKTGKDSCTVDDYSSSDLVFHKNQLLFTTEVDENKWK
jgi:hypothetical protein